MRVCFLLLEPQWDGRARAFREAGVALRERGYEVTLACARGSDTARVCRGFGDDVIEIVVRGGWLGDAWRLRPVLRSRFVEVIFAHGERAQLVAAAAARLAARGAVVRRLPPRGQLTLGADARLANRLAATGFLFTDAHDLRAARPPARALEPVVAPVAAPAVVEPPAGGGPSITCVYDDTTRGALSLALRAIGALVPRHPDLRAILAGPPGDDDAIRIQCAALGIGHAVALVHEPAARAVAIAGARAVWLLADGDDFAYAALDAFAAGVPVIALRSPLAARFVSDDVNGLGLGAADPALAASLLARLIADAPLRERLGAGARASLGRFPREGMADGFARAAAAARDRTRWRT